MATLRIDLDEICGRAALSGRRHRLLNVRTPGTDRDEALPEHDRSMDEFVGFEAKSQWVLLEYPKGIPKEERHPPAGSGAFRLRRDFPHVKHARQERHLSVNAVTP